MNPTRPRRPSVKLNRSAVSEFLNVLNMTQTELAQPCGLSPGYFSLLMDHDRCKLHSLTTRTAECGCPKAAATESGPATEQGGQTARCPVWPITGAGTSQLRARRFFDSAGASQPMPWRLSE